MTVLAFCALAVVPAAIFWGALKALQWWANWEGPHHDPVAAPQPQSMGRLVDDLHRLEREYLRIERSDLPARAARLRAVSLAYDDTLLACCHALGLPEPCERPLSSIVRLETEAELAQHGLVW